MADNKWAYRPTFQYELRVLGLRATNSFRAVHDARVTEAMKYERNGGSHVSGRRGAARAGGARGQRERAVQASRARGRHERAAPVESTRSGQRNTDAFSD